MTKKNKKKILLGIGLLAVAFYFYSKNKAAATTTTATNSNLPPMPPRPLKAGPSQTAWDREALRRQKDFGIITPVKPGYNPPENAATATQGRG